MITYKKRKNSDKWLSPYLNVLVLVIIIGTFVALNLKVSEMSELVVQDAQVPTLSNTEDVDVSGEWVGMMTEDYDSHVRYDYRIVLSQNGDDISGTSYHESINYDVTIYAESSLSGDVEGDDIYFYEQSTDVLANLSLSNWCRIELRLDYEVVDGQETLIGTWDSAEDERAGCSTIDGRVLLTRQSD